MTLIPIALVTLALTGICDAVWLAHAHLFGAAACGAGSGCDAVMASSYSRFLGIPLSTIGLGFYLALTGLAWRALAPDLRDESVRWISVLSATGAVPTVALLYVQGFVIGAWCPFCLLSAALLGSILVVSVFDRRRRGLLKPMVGELPRPRQALPQLVAIAAPSLLFLGIERGMAGTAPIAEASPQLVAHIGDRQITLAEMDRAIQLRLIDTRSDLRNEWLDQQVLEAVGREKGVNVRELLQQEVYAKVRITQQEVDEFYAANKKRMPAGVPRKRLDQQIRGQLGRERNKQGRVDYIRTLRKRFATELIPPPSERIVIDANPRGGPERGAADAPVTIVAFSDLECGHCAHSHRRLDELQRDRPDDIRLVYRHFPLDMHAHARPAAEVAACADQQGQFWPIVEVLFANQRQLRDAQMRGYAEKLGLDMVQLDDCLQSGEGAAVVEADVAEGEELGILSTPSFFVNGDFMVGLPSGVGLDALIDREVTAGGG